jgi:hypothetical protein
MSIETDGNSSETSNFDNTVAAMGALLDREDGTETRKKPAPVVEAEDEESEALEAETEEETSDADAESDDDGAEEEADADEDADEASELDMNRLVTVKIDGKTMQIPLHEALQGYQRTADYTRKTEALAHERKAALAEAEAVRQERAQYAYLLDNLAKQLDNEAAAGEPDWERLRFEDPVEFAVKRLEWQDKAERRRAIAAEQARVNEASHHEAVKAFQETVTYEAEKLREAVPAWKDEKRWSKDRQAIKEYGLSLGFTTEELSSATDHRAVLALYKAMKFDSLAAKTPKPVARAESSPKPLPSGSSNKPPAKVTERIKASKRLAASGSIEDATDFFKTLL